MRRARPAATWLALAAGAAAAIGVATAQPRTARRVLHEEIPGPVNADPTSPTIGPVSVDQNPTALASGDKILPEPADVARAAGEPVFGADGLAADRSTEWQPDRATGPDGTLHYAAVFNPDVVPFKRMSAMDAVGDDYTMSVARRALTELPVGGALRADRDAFWGSLMLELAPGVDVAIPSVAPDMRVLSYETTPRTRLSFSKDGADNFFVRADEAGARGPVRLVFLADADAGYFAPALPDGGRLTGARVRLLAPAELRPNLPAAVAVQARRTLEKLGVDDQMELGVAFNRLVAYFRAFEAKATPPSTGNIYRDLTDHQAGVCRHRSFAFTVTAGALGVPTRYVTNEAHAFVEVWFPERGWQRLDLGGAALRMEVSGAAGKTLHRPRAEDPFARPPAYDNSYTQLAGDIRGLTGDQLDDKREPLDEAPSSGTPSLTGADPGDGPGGLGLDPTLPAREPDPKKATPRLVVNAPSDHAYRGEALSVSGRLVLDGAGLVGRAVDVYLAPAGADLDTPGFVQVGTTLTGERGDWQAEVLIPAELDLAAYEVWALADGDAVTNAALSE